MARIVCVHGAFNELWGPRELHARWLPALRDGLWHHGCDIDDADVAVCFYGDLFRRDPEHDDPVEVARSRAGAAELLARLGGIEGMAQAAARASMERNIDLLSVMRDRVGLADAVHDRFRSVIDGDTRVVVGHSLGSVVAYRALARHPEWQVHTLITLGSPLGDPRYFSTLEPPPVDGRGAWPGAVQRWVNVVALGDPVVGTADLATRFGPRVEDRRVDNGHRAHDPEPYLNSAVTGAAIVAALQLAPGT